MIHYYKHYQGEKTTIRFKNNELNDVISVYEIQATSQVICL
jgi:hypothetical protein